MIVALVPDLMDRSKVQAASAGEEVRWLASAAELPLAAAEAGCRLVVVDLARSGVLDALPAVVATGTDVVAFGSHVDRTVLDAARAAGCGTVLARSEFFRRLEELLAGPTT